MTPQEQLNRNLQIEIGRLVLENITLKTQVEIERASKAEPAGSVPVNTTPDA